MVCARPTKLQRFPLPLQRERSMPFIAPGSLHHPVAEVRFPPQLERLLRERFTRLIDPTRKASSSDLA